METVQSQTTGSPNAISQAAAVVALSHSASLVEPMLRAYRKRHLLLCDRLSDIPGLRFIPSEGSFYLFVNVADAISNLYRSGILEASSLKRRPTPLSPSTSWSIMVWRSCLERFSVPPAI